MNTSGFARLRWLMLAMCLAVWSERRCPAQADGTAPPQAAELLRLRQERELFQAQELITAKRNHWVFQAGEAPRIIWRDVEEVRRLGVDQPLAVRWFNERLEEAEVPAEPGRWGAWIETTAPNGTPLRRGLTFFSPPKEDFIFFIPEVTVSVPPLPESPAAEVWREHEAEFSRLSTDLLQRHFADSELVAIVLAGLTHAQPRGRPPRFAESVEVLHDDYHLALKLKLQNLQGQVRTLQPPRRRSEPATALHMGSPREAGMFPDAKSKIDAVCRAWAEDTGEPFVMLVARRGVIVTHEAFGNDGRGQPIARDYRCWVGSITKSVTALLFSQFVDQGLIDLDDSVARFFPDYPRASPQVPTFRQCFNHTSGLSGHGDFGGFRNPHLENIVLNGIDVNEPNVRYAYSGMGYELAVKALEIVTGKSGVRLYDEHLFRPLNLGDVPIGNASADGRFTAEELAVMAQLVANRGSYGELEFFSPTTFAKLLPAPVLPQQPAVTSEHGIGLHWVRKQKPGAPLNSLQPEDQIFSLNTVGHGSFSGCMFMIDLDQELVIAQARRQTGSRWDEWSQRLFLAIGEGISDDPVARP